MSATIVPTIVDCEQRTPEWHAARCGMPTASRAADILAKIKKGEAAPRRHYREDLMAERLTGIPTDHYVSREMQWGIDQEPFARAAYEVACDVDVETCGFFIHPNIRFGASPDGLVGTDGMVQFKCPNTATHIAWMRAGVIPIEHAPQLLGDLTCSGSARKWIDFVSFDPRLPAHLQLFIVRFYRDEKLIAALEAEVVQFNKELDEELAKLPSVSPAPAVTPQLEDPPPSQAIAAVDHKPTYDDVDPRTGNRKYAKYAEYEAEKDAWLLRQFQFMLERALAVPKGTTLQ